jgi:hypothetical protein
VEWTKNQLNGVVNREWNQLKSVERELVLAEQERSGERGPRNIFERRASFLPLMLRSHALVPIF